MLQALGSSGELAVAVLEMTVPPTVPALTFTTRGIVMLEPLARVGPEQVTDGGVGLDERLTQQLGPGQAQRAVQGVAGALWLTPSKCARALEKPSLDADDEG